MNSDKVASIAERVANGLTGSNKVAASPLEAKVREVQRKLREAQSMLRSLESQVKNDKASLDLIYGVQDKIGDMVMNLTDLY